jgi:hypothetical protein
MQLMAIDNGRDKVMYGRPPNNPDDDEGSDSDAVKITTSEVAEYIYKMCIELSVMAKNARMPLLSYLLKVASTEAYIKYRDSDTNTLTH